MAGTYKTIQKNQTVIDNEMRDQHQSILEMIKERGYPDSKSRSIEHQQLRYKSAIRQRGKPMSDLSTELATYDKGYTPNEKEKHLNKQFKQYLGKNNNVLHIPQSAVQLKTPNGRPDSKEQQRQVQDIKNNYGIQLNEKKFTPV